MKDEVKPRRRNYSRLEQRVGRRNRVKNVVLGERTKTENDVSILHEVVAEKYVAEMAKNPGRGLIKRTANAVGVSRSVVSNALRKLAVERIVNQHINFDLKNAEISRAEVIFIAKCIAGCDMRKMLDKEGRMLHPSLWPDEVAFAMQGMDVEHRTESDGDVEVTTFKPRLASKTAALEILLRLACPELRGQTGVNEPTNVVVAPVIQVNLVQSNGNGEPA